MQSGRLLPVISPLPDGTHLTLVTDCRSGDRLTRWMRLGRQGPMPANLTVLTPVVITYQVTTTAVRTTPATPAPCGWSPRSWTPPNIRPQNWPLSTTSTRRSSPPATG
ncbi:hypothetical protein [Streptomyces mirabilis]|uniref:hypothetical protein n=1 Tax=Streptomyces mirabilis TaxID=68239 RepID=UPI003323E95C